MRIIVLAVLLLGLSSGNSQVRIAQEAKPSGCSPSPALLSRPVVRAMWDQDEAAVPVADALGFIRIAVRPAWDSEFFVDIRLSRRAPPTIVKYLLPKGAKTVTSLLEKVLKKNPCADAATLAAKLPIDKRTLASTKRLEDVIEEFFALRLAPRRIPNMVRLDATQYEVEFIGDDTLFFVSDDYETPMVKWVGSLMTALEADSAR